MGAVLSGQCGVPFPISKTGFGVKSVAQPPPCPEGRLRSLQEPPPCHHFIVGKEAQYQSQGQNPEFWDPSSLFPLLGAPESWRLPKGEGAQALEREEQQGPSPSPLPIPHGPTMALLQPVAQAHPRGRVGGWLPVSPLHCCVDASVYWLGILFFSPS